MLDRLKDIVPEVDETKANLIYQKAKKPKFSFNLNLNLKWVLRVAVFLVLLVPVIVIAGLGNNHKAEAPSFEPEDTIPTLAEPDYEMNESVDESVNLFNGEFFDGVLSLTFSDKYEFYYIKSYEGYNINSATMNGVLVNMVDNYYKVNALSAVEITFNNDFEKVMISISIDGVTYQDYIFNN